MTQKDPAFERARRQVEDVANFWYHLMTYVLVNTLMVIIDLNGGAGRGFLGLDFAYWLIIGWGFGILGHAISVFYGNHRVHKLYQQERNHRPEAP